MTGQLDAIRRVGDTISRIFNEEARFRRYRDYAPWEIRAFQAEIAATGADIGGGPYPVRRSVAFRGPQAPLDRPWHNGMFIDESEPPREQVPYMERNNYYWGYYYRNRNDRHRQAAQSYQQRRPAHHGQHQQQRYYPNYHRQCVYNHQNRQQMLYHEERAHQEEEEEQQKQAEQQEQQEQRRVPTPPPRLTAIQLQEQQTREEARRTALAIINWDKDLTEESVLAIPGAAIERVPTASAESSEEQEQPRGLVPDELTPQWNYVPSEEGGAVEEASLDEDQDYVNSEGYPIRKRTKEQREAYRVAHLERRACLARMYRQQQRNNGSTLVCTRP
ncbi:hypothetical protein BBAD15_g11133 [Beauveria bassiana D1-5]|uniref:Uncharacterized protein n=1 Tax=Beauveria bassiana D1-5 TaxID=1245745 RepID=A0A0A2VS60_BEABA|nr:hypothetical protein BBAD15_g11133 [Beauveria bassiana D1-5]